MSYPVTLTIDPDCANFLSNYKRPLSERQKTFIDCIGYLHNTLNKIKKQGFYKFTESNRTEISRGAFYAISKSLEQQFSQEKKISLESFQTSLKEEFHIQEKYAIDFITMCLIEPFGLPLELPKISYSILGNNYYCSNESNKISNTDFQHSLRAESKKTTKSIAFNMMLLIYSIELGRKKEIGSTTIQFEIDSNKEITLSPVKMEFKFEQKQESKQFQQELLQNFKDWLYRHDDRWSHSDLWFFSSSIGLFIGLIVMISLLALSLTPISPLLFPALGLALGFFVSSMLSTIHCIDRRNDEKKIKRPIHLLKQATPLNLSRQQTTAFFKASSEDIYQLPLNKPTYIYQPSN